jgi:hypothetical protein
MGIITDALGDNTDEYSSDYDIGKGVVLAAGSYDAAAKDDEIEGIITSIEPGTRNSGYSWGGVQTKGRALAVLGASQDTTAAVGDLVVNDTPIAVGTAGIIRVYGEGSTGFPSGPFKFNWRIIRIVSGTGVAGDTVLIERV